MISAQTTIQKILNASETYYEIPNFQRPYAWQTENANEFIADLEDSVARQRNHYFGTVVLVEDTVSNYSVAIIDGQQRVTTSLLMVTAIYHLVKNDPSLIGDKETTSDLIRNRYLFNSNIDKNKVKLRTVTTDNQILQRIFDKDGDENRLDTAELTSNVYQVYSTFKKYFASRKNLNKYIEGLKHFEIMSITLNSSDDNPQRVFESINSTGRPLTDGDKIRNFALMLNDSQQRDRVYDKYWSVVEESLVDTSKDYITDFFRSYIISLRSSIIRLDAVYPEFKKLFAARVGHEQQEEAIGSFYSDVIESLNFYKLLKLDDTEDFKPEYKSISGTIFKMRYLQLDLYIPFALNVLRHHRAGRLNDAELEQAFSTIETYFSRRIVCGIDTTSVDRFMATLHRDVLNHQQANETAEYIDVLNYLFLSRVGQTRLPDANEYENAIRNREAYYQRNSFLTYVLTAVEASSKEAVGTLRQISLGNLKLSIEHVMPQTLSSKDWHAMLGSDFERVHREYLHTLANLTLTGYNSEYSNRAYGEKMHLEVKDKKTGEIYKVGFAESQLPINKWIANHETWNEETLKERQDWWVSNLKKVWPAFSTSFTPAIAGTSVYLLDDIDLTGTSVKSVEVFGELSSVSNWANALDTIVEGIYDNRPDFLERVTEDELLAKSIRSDKGALRAGLEIHDTGHYVDIASSTNVKLRLIHKLAEVYNLSRDDIRAEIIAGKADVPENEMG